MPAALVAASVYVLVLESETVRVPFRATALPSSVALTALLVVHVNVEEPPL